MAEKGKKKGGESVSPGKTRRRRTRRGSGAMLAQARADMAAAFSRLGSAEEVEQAFVDFLTASEMRDLQSRWLIFKMLEDGVTQREISRILGVSLCKITRGSRFLKSPKTIVHRMLAGTAGESHTNERKEKMKPTLLVLAAGMGSRYGGLKQMDPVGPSGETILDYSVYDAIRAGFGKVVFVIRRDFEEAFRKLADEKYRGRIDVGFAFQDLADLPGGRKPPAGRAKPWGTAHAVRAAREAVDTPFAMINADDFYGRDSYAKLASFLADQPSERVPRPVERFCMAGFGIANTLSENGSVARGICSVDRDGRLKTVTERTKISRDANGIFNAEPDGSRLPLSETDLVSMNCWGFTPALFTHMEDQFGAWLDEHGNEEKSEWYIPLVVNTLLAQGRATVDVLKTDSRWFGVTYREDRPATVASIRALVDAGEYPKSLWQ